MRKTEVLGCVYTKNLNDPVTMKVMLSVVGCVAALSSNPFTGDRLQAMERDSSFVWAAMVEAFHDTLHELNSQNLGDSQAWLHGITKLMENVEQQAHARYAQIATRTSMLQKSVTVDACYRWQWFCCLQREASCALVQAFANKCNYARVSLQQSYEAVNVATHVLGVMVSAACGCVLWDRLPACCKESRRQRLPLHGVLQSVLCQQRAVGSPEGQHQGCTMHGDPRISS